MNSSPKWLCQMDPACSISCSWICAGISLGNDFCYWLGTLLGCSFVPEYMEGKPTNLTRNSKCVSADLIFVSHNNLHNFGFTPTHYLNQLLQLINSQISVIWSYFICCAVIPYPKNQSIFWFYVEAARCLPPTAHRLLPAIIVLTK